MGFGGAVGLDYAPFITVIERRGWNLEICLDLLSTIESAHLQQWQIRRDAEQ